LGTAATQEVAATAPAAAEAQAVAEALKGAGQFDIESEVDRLMAERKAIRDAKIGLKTAKKELRREIQSRFPGTLSGKSLRMVEDAVMGRLPVFQLPGHLQQIAIDMGALDAFRQAQRTKIEGGRVGDTRTEAERAAFATRQKKRDKEAAAQFAEERERRERARPLQQELLRTRALRRAEAGRLGLTERQLQDRELGEVGARACVRDG
jgi:hypothetical protein